MRTLTLTALISASAFGQAHSPPPLPPGAGRGISPNFTLRTDPPSNLAEKFEPTAYPRAMLNGPTFFTRVLLDNTKHVYLGYELLIEQQQPGSYRVTFGRLGVTPLEMAFDVFARMAGSSLETAWTIVPLPSIPEPRITHDGFVMSIELFVDPSTGDKLLDDIRIDPPRPVSHVAVPVPTRPIPTISGPAREFTATDAEMQIVQCRVTVNGAMKGVIGRTVRASLIWLYLPDHGRYILSLTPHPGLDFKQAGEVRGGAIKFSLDGDSVTLESLIPIAPGDAPYFLYVLRDPQWEPTSDRQKSAPLTGTVTAAELSALRP